MVTLMEGKPVKGKKELTEYIRKLTRKNDKKILDRLKHGTIPKIASTKHFTIDFVKNVYKEIRKCELDRINSMKFDNWEALNWIIGCKTGGISEGCKNCCALQNGHLISKKNIPIAKLFTEAITIDKNGDPQWSGKIIENPFAFDKKEISKAGTSRNFLISYDGEIAFASEDMLFKILKKICEYPVHNFMFLTELPNILFDKMLIATNRLKKYGININKINNIHVGVSVQNNKYKYKIDELRKFKKFGFALHIWHKPLIGPIIYPCYDGISSIRINCEKGKNKREYKQSWVDSIITEATKQGIQVYSDLKKD